MDNYELLRLAISAREKSYSPYSHFAVGAALLCDDGTVYTGCNIENAAFSATICAERTAFFKAVSDGKKHFSKIAIVGGKGSILQMCFPCGVCRQVMSEFCDDKFLIVLGTNEDDIITTILSELLPLRFGGNNLI